MGGTNLERVIQWFDIAKEVLEYMDAHWLWVRVGTEAIYGAGRVWWISSYSGYLQHRPLERISWEEFREVFNLKFFSSTIRDKKAAEFDALTQANMNLAEYETWFLALERFALGSFANERERIAKFISGLRLIFEMLCPYFSVLS